MKSCFENAAWIWLPQRKAEPNQYVCFRKGFSASGRSARAECHISADSDFILCVNGVECGRGQFGDYPDRKTYSSFDVGHALRKGANVLSVLAYYRGADFSEHRAGAPGLIASLAVDGRELVATDSSWRALPHPSTKGGGAVKVTAQQGFVMRFDASKDIDGWRELKFDDSKWKPAVVVESRGEIVERPLPPLKRGAPLRTEIVSQGYLIRGAEKETFALTMRSDFLSFVLATGFYPGFDFEKAWAGIHLLAEGGEVRKIMPPAESPANGAFVIVDLGAESAGNLLFSIEAPKGTVVDIAHGEHLDDGVVRMAVGGRNFADRYICKEGLNEFEMPFRRLGCRYLQFHFTKFKKPLTLRYIGLIPTTRETDHRPAFASNDAFVNKCHQTGVATLDLCMHDHYEDCPWREQSLYAYDSRNQALFGYYAFGNYKFAETSIKLLGGGLRDDGMLELCAPARVPVTIPVFSLVWIVEAMEHWLHSGSSEVFDSSRNVVEAILEKALSRLCVKTGLFMTSDAKGVWNFYEWSPGLCKNVDGEEFNCAYNLYLHEALRCAAWMFKQKGVVGMALRYAALADALGRAVNRHFLYSDGCYATSIANGRKDGRHEHIQALALHEGIVPADKVAALLKGIYSGKLVPLTFSPMAYLLDSLMEVDAESRRHMDKLIYDAWSPMVFSGAGSFWETPAAGKDFALAGSLCHGWSALPVYFQHAYVLGIRPREPGFAKFAIRPYPGMLFNAKGTVPTPAGVINVKWKASGEGLIYEAEGPSSLTPVLEAYPEFPVAAASYNGRRLKR